MAGRGWLWNLPQVQWDPASLVPRSREGEGKGLPGMGQAEQGTSGTGLFPELLKQQGSGCICTANKTDFGI